MLSDVYTHYISNDLGFQILTCSLSVTCIIEGKTQILWFARCVGPLMYQQPDRSLNERCCFQMRMQTIPEAAAKDKIKKHVLL